MGLLSNRKPEQIKAARRIAEGQGFIVRSAEALRFFGTDRPLPGSTTPTVTSELETNPVADAEQNLHVFLETDPYMRALDSINASEKVTRIAAHVALDAVLDKHFAQMAEPSTE